MLKRWFGKGDPPRQIDHSLYGRITYSKKHGWENPDFELWGYRGVQLMINADEHGPTGLQDTAFVKMRHARDTLLPRCLEAVAAQRAETDEPAGTPTLTSLSIPSLAEGRLWTMWWDYPGEEHWSYGVQSEDEWVTLRGFADD